MAKYSCFTMLARISSQFLPKNHYGNHCHSTISVNAFTPSSLNLDNWTISFLCTQLVSISINSPTDSSFLLYKEHSTFPFTLAKAFTSFLTISSISYPKSSLGTMLTALPSFLKQLLHLS